MLPLPLSPMTYKALDGVTETGTVQVYNCSVAESLKTVWC